MRAKKVKREDEKVWSCHIFMAILQTLYFRFIISCCRRLIVLAIDFFFFMKIYIKSINSNTSIFALDEVINPFNEVHAVSFSKK